MKRKIRITENELRNLISERVTKALKKKSVIKESMGKSIESQYYGFLIDSGIVSEDALQLVVNINGYSIDTLDDVLYAATGYRSLDQLTDEFDMADYFDSDALDYFGLSDEEDEEDDWEDDEDAL